MATDRKLPRLNAEPASRTTPLAKTWPRGVDATQRLRAPPGERQQYKGLLSTHRHTRRHKPAFRHLVGLGARTLGSHDDKADSMQLTVHRVAPLCRDLSFTRRTGMPQAAGRQANHGQYIGYHLRRKNFLEGLLTRSMARVRMPCRRVKRTTTPTRRQFSRDEFDSLPHCLRSRPETKWTPHAFHVETLQPPGC